MKSFLYTLVAVAALSLGGVFTSTAQAQYPHHHHHHHGGYGGYGGYSGGYYNSYRPAYYGGYGYAPVGPVYGGYGYAQPYYYQPNSIYFNNRNFGFGIGF